MTWTFPWLISPPEVNSDLVGKLVNIASRCAGFVERAGGVLAAELPEPALYDEFAAARERIGSLYETREYATAMREIMLLADRATSMSIRVSRGRSPRTRNAPRRCSASRRRA